MGKSTHFSGQPLYSQIIKLLDKSEILRISSEQGAERYVKSFDAWTHLLVIFMPSSCVSTLYVKSPRPFRPRPVSCAISASSG